MKQKIHKFLVWLFGSPKYKLISRLDWIRMFIRSRYRLSVYKRTFWQYCEENLHPRFLIDSEFLLTSTQKQKVRYLTGLYTRREIAHRKSIGEDFDWLLKNKVSYPTFGEIASLPSC